MLSPLENSRILSIGRQSSWWRTRSAATNQWYDRENSWCSSISSKFSILLDASRINIQPVQSQLEQAEGVVWSATSADFFLRLNMQGPIESRRRHVSIHRSTRQKLVKLRVYVYACRICWKAVDL